MKPLRVASVESADEHALVVALEHGWRARVTLPAGRYGRITLLPPGGYREPRTWAIARERDVPWEGRARDDATGIAPAACTLEERPGEVTLRSGDVAAVVRLEPFGVGWQLRAGDAWRTVATDRRSYAYAVSTHGTRIVHSAARDEHDHYYGLGDKTGPLDLRGRRLRTLQLDALGYDAAASDPLYKHWPFFAGRRADSGAWYGVYYDTLSETTFDLGQEFDNYHGFYRSTEIADGDLDAWFVPGPSLRAVVRAFVELVGPTAMPPRWSLGYANTAMALADAPDAQERIAAFVARASDERIPLSAFHLGSGYSSRGKRRYVFTWNADKFPDPRSFARACRERGVRLVANIKPCLLDDHPAYREVAASGAFVSLAPGGAPALGQFWDGWGAHVDFTHPAGVAWWQRGLAAQVLDVGIDAGWNDNNEYEIWDEDAVANGFGAAMPVARTRPLQALLMTRATAEAQARHAPGERVYTVTRAGPPGIQRHAQTWTGDNTTSWRTLRWNQRMALTMALSGLFDTGHDVGGFAGPVPDAELLVRWAQACALNPRFLMNSWKSDGSVNSPWLHDAALPHIRAAILLRLALLPYLYTHRWLASVEHVPVLRPTFFAFPGDPRCHEDCDEMMVGPDLLIAPVFEAGATERELYLPADDATPAWCELDTGRWHEAGRTLRVAAPLERLPLFVRAGAVVPTAQPGDGARRTDEPSRLLRCFPAPAGSQAAPRESVWVEDDGLTHAWRHGGFMRAMLRVEADDREVRLDVRREAGDYVLPQAAIGACLPAGDARTLALRGDGLGVPLLRE
jgi:alpha-glucosidase